MMKDITVQELIKEKEGLEIEIQQELTSLIDDFKSRTGYCPCNISISMIETTSLESQTKEYMLGNVEVGITLEGI